MLDTGSIKRDVLLENRWFFTAGTKKLLPSGTAVSLYQEVDHLNSNSEFVVPDPQATSRLILEVSQPLLKGFWDRNNRAIISIARLNVGISNEEFLTTVMDVVAEVGKVYWQLVMQKQAEYIAAGDLGDGRRTLPTGERADA